MDDTTSTVFADWAATPPPVSGCFVRAAAAIIACLRGANVALNCPRDLALPRPSLPPSTSARQSRRPHGEQKGPRGHAGLTVLHEMLKEK